MMEAIRSAETSFLAKAIQRKSSEDGILNFFYCCLQFPGFLIMKIGGERHQCYGKKDEMGETCSTN
jgi:hypothetical protein